MSDEAKMFIAIVAICGAALCFHLWIEHEETMAKLEPAVEAGQ